MDPGFSIGLRTNICAVRTNRGPLPDDILLSDVNGDLVSPLSPSFPK